MANLLNNPTLSGFTLGHYFTEANGQVGTIENPPGWEFICFPRESDPNKLPQSLHRDRGFVIAAGYRAWEGGYVQKGIQLQANQRYLAKVQFKPDINFNGNVDLTAITWRFRFVSSNGQALEEDWTMTSKNQYKQDEEHTFVFDSTDAQTIEFQFMARSYYAGNVADFNIYQMSLEPVDANYGGNPVSRIGAVTNYVKIINGSPVQATQASTPTQTPAATSSSTPPPTPIITSPIVTNTAAVSPTMTGPGGKDLASVLSTGEIEVIVIGLRELARQVNPVAAAGLNTLANGIERLK